jgi:hypothetical protein
MKIVLLLIVLILVAGPSLAQFDPRVNPWAAPVAAPNVARFSNADPRNQRVVYYTSSSGQPAATTVPDFSPFINDASAKTIAILMQFYPWILGMLGTVVAIALVRLLINGISK